MADQIVHTCAALLHSIPHANMQIDIVHDFIKLLRDLGTLHSIGIFDDDSEHEGDIGVLLFSHDRSEKEFEVGLVTKEELLLLTCSVYQLLFQLCVMQNGQQPDDELDSSTESENGLFQSRFQIDGEHREILLRCIGEVLETSSKANNDSPTCAILSLQSKLMACHLLHLILPEYGCQADAMGVGGSQWTAIVDIIISAVRNHLVELECRGDGNGPNERLLNWMSDSISNRMVMLLRNAFISPPLQWNLLANQMWSLQSKFVYRLFDCLPAISIIQGIARKSEQLSAMILRAIQISVCHDALKPQANLMQGQHDLDQFLQTLFDYCNMNNLWNPLVSLLSSSSQSTVVVSIIAQLLGSCKEDLIIQRACDAAIERNANDCGKKRRRLDEGSDYESCRGGDNDEDYSDVESLTLLSSFSNYLLFPLQEMGDLPRRSIDDVNDPEVNGEVTQLMLQKDGLKVIFETIFVIESLLIQQNVALDSKYRSVISMLKQLYEVGVLLSKTFVTSCSNGCLDYAIDGARSRIMNLIGSMSRILYNDEVASVLCHNLKPIRQELSSSIFDAALQCWLSYSPPTDPSHIRISNIESLQPLDDAKESIAGLSSNQVDLTNKYLKSHIVPCGKACRRLAQSLGVPLTNGRNCFACTCHLLGDASDLKFGISNKHMSNFFLKSSVIVLIEDVLPVQNWYVL